MKKLSIICAAAVALMVQGGVAERMPSASQDSNPASLDTRIGASLAVCELALDSRTGSWDVSNLRGLNTTKIGVKIFIR